MDTIQPKATLAYSEKLLELRDHFNMSVKLEFLDLHVIPWIIAMRGIDGLGSMVVHIHLQFDIQC